MKSHYSIWIISPPDYPYSRCFEELALGLQDGLIALGFTAEIVTTPDLVKGTAIVLGSDILDGYIFPADAILFNLEQVGPQSPYFGEKHVALLRQHRVWDYSRLNIAALAKLGISAALCEIGYVPALTRIAPAPVQDIDVLFIGVVNDRRLNALRDMQAHGIKVAAGHGFYGAERDALFARAKIVLNLHYFEAKIFEIVRVSYLLANRICVVSEAGQDRALEAPLEGGIAFAPYQGLTDTCLRLLADDHARVALGDKGFEIFSARSQAEMLRAALGANLALTSNA